MVRQPERIVSRQSASFTHAGSCGVHAGIRPGFMRAYAPASCGHAPRLHAGMRPGFMRACARYGTRAGTGASHDARAFGGKIARPAR